MTEATGGRTSYTRLPACPEDSLCVVDGMTGSRDATVSMLAGDRLVGLPASAGMIQGTAATAATVPIAMAPRGAVRIRGGVWTLNEIAQWVEAWAARSQIDEAVRRFHLDRNSAPDLLAAAAYVWASVKMPMNARYWDVPFSGPANMRVAEAVMRYERAHPGTIVLATRNDEASLRALDRVVADAYPTEATITERTSAVSPALSTNSARARRIAGLLGNQRWQAHHIIPFATVARLPRNVQQAIAASGWRMDSFVNLIPLPANYFTYLMPPNLAEYPYHSGPHGHYDADVWNALQPISTGAALMTAQALNAAMEGVDWRFRNALRDDPTYKPRLN